MRNKILLALTLLFSVSIANAFKVGGMNWVTTDGTVGQVMKTDGAGNLGWLTAIGPTFLSATAPLSYNSTSGVLLMPVGTSGQNGYISSSDWTNFNNRITGLSGDVTATGPTGSTGPSIVAATVATVGGSTAANIHTSQLATAAATDANTASTIVKRDASGNFTAGTVTVGQEINSGLTASTVPYANASKQMTSSAVTPTELGYLSGVTSAIQTQFGTKVDTIGAFGAAPTANGAIITGTSLILEPGDATHPGSVTTAGQTFAGVKTFSSQPIMSSLTASQAVFSDSSKGLVSNAITGSGNVVMSASPTMTGTIGAASETLSGTLGVTGVATFTAQPIMSSLTASQAVFSDSSKGLVSNAISGSGSVCMTTNCSMTTPALGTPSAVVLTNATGTAASLTAGLATDTVSKTGTGSTYATSTSPVFTTPNLGTPSALVLTNASGTVTNLTLVNPALGTPASGVMTNVSGTAASLTAGLATDTVSKSGTGSTYMTTASPTTTGTFTAAAIAATGVVATTNQIVAGNATVDNTTTSQKIQALATDASAGFKAGRFSANSSGAQIVLNKSRGASVGTLAVVTTADSLGNLTFQGVGTDTIAYSSAAAIIGKADGTIGSAIVPGLLDFQTANSSGTLTDRLTIDSTGLVANAGNETIAGTLGVTGTTTAAAINASGNYLASKADTANLVLAQYNSSNANAGIYGNGRSGNAFLGGNLDSIAGTSTAGGTYNYKTTNNAWALGDPAGNGAFNIYSIPSGTAASLALTAVTATPTIKVSTTGVTTFNGNGASQAVFQITSGSNPGGAQYLNPASSGHYNWLAGMQNTANDTFEITPSTATDGTTYSSPAIKMDRTGLVTVPGALTVSGTTTLGTTNTGNIVANGATMALGASSLLSGVKGLYLHPGAITDAAIARNVILDVGPSVARWTTNNSNKFIQEQINWNGGYRVDTGVTMSGDVTGVYNYGAARDTDTNDAGTMSNLYAYWANFGNVTTNATAVTTNTYGLDLTPKWQTGTVSNVYDIYLHSATTGGTGPTAGHYYGIYQEDTAAQNLFGGTTDATSSTAAATMVSGGLAVAKKLYVGTQLSVGNAMVMPGYTTSSISNGATLAVATGAPGAFNSNTSAIAGATIKLPASPGDGQMFWFASAGVITTVTWQDSGGTAGNVVGGQATIGGAGHGQQFFYNSSSSKWYAIN